MFTRTRHDRVRASSAFVRLFVRGLQWDAEDAGATFSDTLKTAARARLTNSARGKVLIGTASNGTSSTFSLPPLGDLTGNDVADVCSVLLDKVDAIRAADDAITDEALVVALLGEFESVRAVGYDFRGYQQ